MSLDMSRQAFKWELMLRGFCQNFKIKDWVDVVEDVS